MCRPCPLPLPVPWRSLTTILRLRTGTRSSISRCFALTSQSMRAEGNARRSAAATGIAWTMSPRAPKRTRRKEDGKLIAAGSDARQQLTRRMVLGIADDGGSTAVGRNHIAFGNCVDRVVRTLAVHVGTEQGQQPRHSRFCKDDHVVDGSQGGHELGAILRSEDRASWTFQASHRSIIVHADNQAIALRFCALEISHVADVQQIEASVRERNRPARCAVASDDLDELRFVDDLPHSQFLILNS